MRSDLWGEAGDLDYWSALALGQVGGSERKAVDLLRRVVDEERAQLYLQTGMLPIMGNVTRRCYFALKSGGCLEMEDGVPVAWWCFSVGPYAPDIPDTDQVLSVRMIVEGEELAMFTTGDRHPRGYHFTKHQMRRRFAVADPFAIAFMDRRSPRPDRTLKTEELLDLADLFPSGTYTVRGIQYQAAAPMPVHLEDGAADGPHFAQGVGMAQNAGVQYPGQGIAAYVNAGVANVNYQNVAGNVGLGQYEGDQDFKRPVRRAAHEERLAQEERANGEAMGISGEVPETNDLSDNLNEEMRGRVRQAVDRYLQRHHPYAGPAERRAYLLPRIPGWDQPGVDMHNGQILAVDIEWAQRFFIERGVNVWAKILDMQNENYAPEVIEAAVNRLALEEEGDPVPGAA
jgi:hypothetical protein